MYGTGPFKNCSRDFSALARCSSLSQSTALFSLTVKISLPLSSVRFIAGSLASIRMYAGRSLNRLPGVMKINASMRQQMTSYWIEPLSNDQRRNRFILDIRSLKLQVRRYRCRERPAHPAFRSTDPRMRPVRDCALPAKWFAGTSDSVHETSAGQSRNSSYPGHRSVRPPGQLPDDGIPLARWRIAVVLRRKVRLV